MVLPQQPPGTEALSEDALADLVTRNAMIGTERLGQDRGRGLGRG